MGAILVAFGYPQRDLPHFYKIGDFSLIARLLSSMECMLAIPVYFHLTKHHEALFPSCTQDCHRFLGPARLEPARESMKCSVFGKISQSRNK